jgi:hypothetical protein
MSLKSPELMTAIGPDVYPCRERLEIVVWLRQPLGKRPLLNRVQVLAR